MTARTCPICDMAQNDPAGEDPCCPQCGWDFPKFLGTGVAVIARYRQHIAEARAAWQGRRKRPVAFDFLRTLHLAAEQGDVDTAFVLGLIHECSWGLVPQDLAGAVRWYRRAAAGGQSEAQAALRILEPSR